MAVSKASRFVSLFLALFLFGSTVGALVLVIVQGRDGASQSDYEELLNQQASMEEACEVDPSNETATKTDPGKPIKLSDPVKKLKVTDLKEGTGDTVALGDCVTLNYRLSLANGTVVEGNDTFTAGVPVAFDLTEGSLIAGWLEGLPGAKVGGLRRLIVPAAEGFGADAREGIPANSDLIFDIEIIDIER